MGNSLIRWLGSAGALLLVAACGNSKPIVGGGTVTPPGPAGSLQCLAQPAAPPEPTVRPVNLAANIDMRIQSIMPPGQSGHFPSALACPESAGSCIVPGQAPETYGPHIDDQRLMYWRSEFKPGEFLDTSDLEPALILELTDPVADSVRVYRDPFGVPVVHAETDYGVWYGAGYALAQDRLFLIDQAVRQARGTAAEVLGSGSVPADVQTRVLTYTEAEYQAMFDRLSEAPKRALDAHVAGINAWIDEVNAIPLVSPDLPQEFVALNYAPQHISAIDVLALGVLMTRFVAAAGGDEMANVQALRELEAQHGKDVGRRIFKDVMWLDDQRADVTIADRQFTNISTPAHLRDAVFEAAADFAATIPLELADGPGTGAFPAPAALPVAALPKDYTWPVPPEQLAAALESWQHRPSHISASYMMVASPAVTADGSTLLVNGPQLGYTYPTLLAEVEVHGGGYDARGTTVAGLPVVGIGYGERTVWGLTTGESKTIDSFIVDIVSEDGLQYRHAGETKTMDCHTETVNYRQAVMGVPVVAEPAPGSSSLDVEVCRTVQGPVVARSADGSKARVVQYAMWKRETDTIEGVLEWNRVDTFPEFYAAMARVTWNENTMYADADGNIAYFHPGLHPWRHPSADQRLPLKGDGSQDHCDTLSFANTPKSINPPRGYLHNWNNKPAVGWGDGTGGDASQEPSAADGRNVNWEQVIRAELDGDGLTHADLVEMDKRIGRIDPRAAALLAPLLNCESGCGVSANGLALIAQLKTWDRQHYNDAIDIEAAAGEPGSLDTAGATIFGHVVERMVDLMTADVLPADFITRHRRRGNHPYDAGTFHKLLAKILDPGKSTIPVQHDWLQGLTAQQFIAGVLELSYVELANEYGAEDPARFQRVHARSAVCSLADPLVGPCLDMPHQDRGSWLKLVGFVPG